MRKLLSRHWSVLAASLLVSVGPEIALRETWADLGTPAGVGSLVGIAGGVILAWCGKSPLGER